MMKIRKKVPSWGLGGKRLYIKRRLSLSPKISLALEPDSHSESMSITVIAVNDSDDEHLSIHSTN